MKASKSSMPTCFKMEVKKQVQHHMSEMHYHDFYEIYIQDQCEREHLVGNRYYRLSPHDVMLLKPNVLHQSISNHPHTRTLLYFTKDYLLTHFSAQQCEKFLSIYDTQVLSLSSEHYFQLSQLVKELQKEDYWDDENLIFIKLGAILMILFKSSRQTIESPFIPPTETVSSISMISPLLSYVHENYLTLHNITEIATTFYITPSHLCRTFKKLTGHTIIQYINLLKIQKACTLLRETNKSITVIALECGFHSPMYFCKTFKSILHVTPKSYRNKK